MQISTRVHIVTKICSLAILAICLRLTLFVAAYIEFSISAAIGYYVVCNVADTDDTAFFACNGLLGSTIMMIVQHTGYIQGFVHATVYITVFYTVYIRKISLVYVSSLVTWMLALELDMWWTKTGTYIPKPVVQQQQQQQQPSSGIALMIQMAGPIITRMNLSFSELEYNLYGDTFMRASTFIFNMFIAITVGLVLAFDPDAAPHTYANNELVTYLNQLRLVMVPVLFTVSYFLNEQYHKQKQARKGGGMATVTTTKSTNKPATALPIPTSTIPIMTNRVNDHTISDQTQTIQPFGDLPLPPLYAGDIPVFSMKPTTPPRAEEVDEDVDVGSGDPDDGVVGTSPILRTRKNAYYSRGGKDPVSHGDGGEECPNEHHEFGSGEVGHNDNKVD